MPTLSDYLFDPAWRRQKGGGYRLDAEYLCGEVEPWARIARQGNRWGVELTDHSTRSPTAVPCEAEFKTAKEAKAFAEEVLCERLDIDLSRQLLTKRR